MRNCIFIFLEFWEFCPYISLHELFSIYADSFIISMQFCLLNGIKKTDRRLIKKKVLWRLFRMLRYLYWLPELQWQQLELCLEFFLPIACCHSLAIFWEEERFFPWLQCCLYFHAFCIYQTASALRKKKKFFGIWCLIRIWSRLHSQVPMESITPVLDIKIPHRRYWL